MEAVRSEGVRVVTRQAEIYNSDAFITFLRINGVSIVDPSGRLNTAMIALATRELDKFGLAKLLGELAG